MNAFVCDKKNCMTPAIATLRTMQKKDKIDKAKSTGFRVYILKKNIKKIDTMVRATSKKTITTQQYPNLKSDSSKGFDTFADKLLQGTHNLS